MHRFLALVVMLVAKADFFTGCGQGDSSRNGMCECLWKKVRAKFSGGQIASGTADLKTLTGLDQCKTVTSTATP